MSVCGRLFNRHNWSSWSDPFCVKMQKVTSGFGDTKEVDVTIQSRTCNKCCKVETRWVHYGEVKKEVDDVCQGC
jgi:hypothetical protein